MIIICRKRGRKFLYFYPHHGHNNPENWRSSPEDSYGFPDDDSARTFMKKNKGLFDYDDTPTDFIKYDTKHCPHCMRETIRRDAVDMTEATLIVEMLCTSCNTAWRDHYRRTSTSPEIIT
jgi:hypothetical protein